MPKTNQAKINIKETQKIKMKLHRVTFRRAIINLKISWNQQDV